ncbi:TPA: hypothetical protein QDZ28_004266 [Pseudomonas putida]|nr:hypothetical protein [Pseudomonas putida]
MGLIHLTPHFIVSQDVKALDLVDVTCTELDFRLQNGIDLTVRRPWPNKDYRVACRKQGQKAILGFLVERELIPDDFTVVTRWSLHHDRILTHTVRYSLVDRDYDFVSDLMSMWSSTGDNVYHSRWPDVPEYGSPAASQPRMHLDPDQERKGIYRDFRDDTGRLCGRDETVYVPTLELGRLKHFSSADRLPDLASAF